MAALSLELERRPMLVPVDIMLDLLIEDRADLPINAIHMATGYPASLHRQPQPLPAEDRRPVAGAASLGVGLIGAIL